MLVQESSLLAKTGTNLILTNLKRPVREYLIRGNYWKEIGNEWIFDTAEGALQAINRIESRAESPPAS
jgi:hypothetical protein